MDSIFTYIKDPGWWFTAFFIAIFTSVIAGFLKDAIERRLSALSARYRSWREEKAKRRELLISALAGDPSFLIISSIRSALLVALYLFAAIMFMLIPMLTEILQNTCASLATAANCRARNSSLSGFLIPLLGGFTTFIGYKATTVLSIMAKATKKYRESKGYPRVG